MAKTKANGAKPTQADNTAFAANFPGFDEAYGNPAYVGTLHLKIADHALQICKEGGQVNAIHPHRWMGDLFYDKKKRKTARQKFHKLYAACSNEETMERITAVELFDCNSLMEYNLCINTYTKGYVRNDERTSHAPAFWSGFGKIIKSAGYDC